MLSHINIGTGIDCTILALAQTIANVVGYKGDIVFDKTKLDGTARKLMNVERINNMGWSSKVPLKDGIEDTYQWYLNNLSNMRM